ncbi:beta-lactamase [Pseudomonas putida]|uniref:class C beta-lactamase n=1 Tax=Pseudomonas putida TaxID=303 RepID=UPI00125FD30C|nr:beta-lactamase [Pseudomonas putida]
MYNLRPALLTLAVAMTATPALADDLQRQVDAIVQPLMQAQRIPGMAVAVYANGQAHYFSYGVANKADNRPVTRDTLFEVGSVSKTYTATLVALASAQGKLDLDAPASRYQPALEKSALGSASVLELGAYSADCLPLQFPDEVSNDAQALVFLQQWQQKTERGTRRCYSNPSLGLFGNLAAQAQKRPFAELMRQDLLPGLGLKHTFLQVPAADRSRYAQGYDANERPIRVSPGPFADEAYGIKTSATDMLAYLRAQLDPQGLSADMAKAIAITHGGYFQVGDMTQGLGWERYPYPVALDTLVMGNGVQMIREAQATKRLQPAQPDAPGYWYNKTGATTGFGAYVAFVPAKGIAIALLANRNYPNDERVRAAHAILSAVAP